jgi:23S rRNA (adenine2503-C2)-methyltransferase
LNFQTPRPGAVARFGEILEQGGLTVAVRHRKGARIDAACGQLRRSLNTAASP